MLNKCYYYAQVASLFNTIIRNIEINTKNHRSQVYVNYKPPEEAADHVIELELLEAMFLLIFNQSWS